MTLLLDEKYYPAAKALIESAKKEVLISSFKYEHSNRTGGRSIADLFRTLGEAAQRGCLVRVLANSISGQSKLIAINKASVRILTQAGCQVKTLPGRRTVHAKILITDDKRMILGSHNWTARSLTSNFELSILVDDPHLVTWARAIFSRLWDAAHPF